MILIMINHEHAISFNSFFFFQNGGGKLFRLTRSLCNAGPGDPHQKHAQNHFRLMDLQPKPRFYKKIKSLSQFYDHSVEKDWLQHLS